MPVLLRSRDAGFSVRSNLSRCWLARQNDSLSGFRHFVGHDTLERKQRLHPLRFISGIAEWHYRNLARGLCLAESSAQRVAGRGASPVVAVDAGAGLLCVALHHELGMESAAADHASRRIFSERV